ncbi:uncharacterized protein LOC112178168 [Rosa chinensis]|uniref:uncharacterized protein LOC112178168 n=1 Tax=Rosa chinensis TaxID=74649 RepID=UPI000D097DF1|nr:uncharacterized protein LOC112178168 [Rosa chinensis]
MASTFLFLMQAFKIISWNCRGLNNTETQDALVSIVRQQNPSLVFLSETLASPDLLTSVRSRIGFDGVVCALQEDDCCGLVFWHNEDPVLFRHYSANHIDAEVGILGSRGVFRFTGLYGVATIMNRVITWNLLCTLAAQVLLPWLVAGDFNEILNHADKSGGPPRSVAQMALFRQALVDYELIDMGFVGPRFTWSNRFTEERMDRACQNVQWRELYLFSRCITLPLSRSDHCPILIEVSPEPAIRTRTPKLFRFGEMWLQHMDCLNVVQQGWMLATIGELMMQVGRKIKQTVKLLLHWHSGVFQQRQTQMKLIQGKLDVLMKQSFEPGHFDVQKALQFDSMNCFRLMKLIGGKDLETGGSDPTATEAILECLHPKVSTDMNDDLTAPYSDSEIKKALFQMHPSKSPSPDGMSPFREILTTGQISQESNFTHLTLIQKVKEPKSVSDLRPIALCNVVYKIASKVLAKQVEEGLSELISSLAEHGVVKGIKMSPTAPTIHHLLFAVGSFLFGEVAVTECHTFKNILETYAKTSGQHINLQKSSVVFSGNVSLNKRNELAAILGVECVKEHGLYLWLPIHVGQNKSDIFAYLKPRLTKKLISWRPKILSIGGKELLINMVAQTPPNYVMNCYALPKSLCDDLQQLCCQFFWGNSDDRRRIHWRSWERMCLPKEQGGMGFKYLHAYNLAMLAKQGWRLLTNPNSLVAQVFKAMYCLYGSFLTADMGERPSFS